MSGRHEELREAVEALRKKVATVKMRTGAVVMDAYEVLEAVQRSRARRTGKPFEPIPVENFVSDRSNRIH